jgi:hypothetical protein
MPSSRRVVVLVVGVVGVVASTMGVACEKHSRNESGPPKAASGSATIGSGSGGNGRGSGSGSGSGGDAGSAGRPPRSKYILDGISTEPAVAMSDAEAKAQGIDCPPFIGAQSTGAQMSGRDGRVLAHEKGWVWQSRKSVHVFGPTSGKPIHTTPASSVPKGIVAMDDDAWYVRHCETGGCGPHGTGVVVDRVERTGGATKQVVPPQSEIASAEIVGDFLYWATFGPYGESGALSRVTRTGGKVEVLWSGGGVNDMVIDGEDAFVVDDTTLVQIPLTGGKPIELAKKLENATDVEVRGDTVFFIEGGDPYWAAPASGFVRSVPRGGGKVTTLAGPLDHPSVVTADETRVYWMLQRSGTIWSIDRKPDAEPVMLVPQPPRDGACLTSVWIRADQQGLMWLRKAGMAHGGTLWRLNRSELGENDTPMASFRRYYDAHPEQFHLGSGAEGAAGSASAGSAAVDTDTDDAP